MVFFISQLKVGQSNVGHLYRGSLPSDRCRATLQYSFFQF